MKSPPVPGSGEGRQPKVPPHVMAEASVWIARLHGPSRSPEMERECLAWQAQSALHRQAFEWCTDAWVEVRGVRVSDAYRSAAAMAKSSGAESSKGSGTWRPWWTLMSAAAMIVVGAAFALHHWRGGDVYETRIGELQSVMLNDGTRMSLNTETRLRVDLGTNQRSVTVQGGEAMFEVAKDPHRPFIVRVGDSEVVVVGTVFSVRLTGGGGRGARDALAVTLIEGEVTLRAASGNAPHGIAPPQPMQMRAGDRVRLAKPSTASAAVVPQLDRPRIEQVVAWKRSEVVFEDVSLGEAVAEMNRYNRTPIVLPADIAVSGLRVSGLYRTGDSSGFAHAVAALHGLAVHDRGGRLELAGHH